MSGDPGNRRLLPQSSQMQSFSFAPNNYGQRENQKNYVFVDEHNRHKRLKVMRACEGCRRRKIKCDAATTNTWPCSACIRLKLHCVPPTVNYDRDFPSTGQSFEPERGVGYESTGSGDEEYHQQVSMQQHSQLHAPHKSVPPIYTQQVPYPEAVGVYPSIPYGGPSSAQSQPSMHPYSNLQTPVSVIEQHQHYSQQNVFPTPPMQGSHPQSPESYEQDQYGQQNLADLLGELRMDEAGTAPYLNNKSKNKTLVEEPALEDVDEFKSALPPSMPSTDLKVRIPPELMPDESTILHYFDMYFANVHPDAISPLILEAIFAIAGRLADEPAQGHQWLALASKHADSFMDVPRLSTLQATLIVLKARESSPKRGYYYRSWMTVVQCVQMAKDLGLDEHYEEHKAGRPCGSDLADCITKTRIWQTIFVCELMIGSPQGRTDLAVNMETLDFSLLRPVPGFDESEFNTSRNFTYFSKVVRNVRRMNNVYAKIKKKKEWGLDPDFVQLNPSFDVWMNDLPPDLQVTFPPDGSPPWLPSHFIGNLHSYYYLSIIMLHRPQLTFMEPTGMDGGWKHHMMICYSSAKLLCRLQEAVVNTFGMTGLICMQRGINFTIYCVLTCTVLHLVALTSPDPDLNADAREYFTRHMRILEKCTASWPMPEMQAQIDALREAFSADTRKPFVLKPSFPYGSPGAPVHSSPPRSNTQYRSIGPHGAPVEHQHTQPHQQGLVMMAAQRAPPQSMPSGVPMADSNGWNPTRIFDQWNTTFGTPPAANASTSQQPPLKLPASGAHEIPTLPEMHTLPNVSLPPGSSQPLPPQQYSGAPVPSFVSPSMWQESVASVYEGGLKRQWDYDESNMSNSKRPR
ncbi:Zn2/Cys6 DNA-binding protein [Glarea lozoyensis ATCC 20868]|uniref:Zn2/Cys6 DNA-binding protein n=1 Tax=Glarea lozoyensis (strain ATCC 20868 / MF5171) TaxID=1116229 RepID=S3DC76_GLAL2|nr:Zn2/Cys6 DNA-binding protein [Glarea lozoyensis ATCC 20868]EPE36032.1 Zn2/Cys6 DNA-binding protein [Glarea lozoyensis ATCC 20868]